MTIVTTVELTTLNCATCGVSFAMPSVVEASRRKDQELFFCPNGHRLYFPPQPPPSGTEERKAIRFTLPSTN